MALSESFTNDELKDRIKSIYAKFVTGVEPERLSDWLVQENVITPERWHRIHGNYQTRESRCRVLLTDLFCIPHPRAFLVVRRYLVEENHYLLEDIDGKEPGSGIRSLPDMQNALQETTQEPGKDHEDLKKTWKEEEFRLLNRLKAYEDQERAWKEEEDRLLKRLKNYEDQERAWKEEEDRLLNRLKDYEDQERAWKEDKERLLKMQLDLEAKLHLKFLHDEQWERKPRISRAVGTPFPRVPTYFEPCRESNQLKTRARHLVSMSDNSFPADFSCDRVIFKPSNFAHLFRKKQITNVIGDVHEDSTIDHPALTTVAHAAENDERERRKKIVSETMLPLSPHYIALIAAEKFKKKMKLEHPDIEFKVKQTDVILTGMPDEVNKAKLFIVDELFVAFQDSFPVSEITSRLFAKDETKLYLTKRLFSEGISASWSCNDRSVIVYAFEDKDLTEAVYILKNEVIERSLQLSALNLREDLGKSKEWKDFMECLFKEDELLEVSVNESVLMVACMKSSFRRNKGRIETFLAKTRELYSPLGFLLKRFEWH